MGSLNFATGSRIYVDAQILIYTVETYPRYWLLLRELWKDVQDGLVTVFTSELSGMECLVLPLRNKDVTLVAGFEGFFLQAGFTTLPITASVLRAAAELRAQTPRLRTPDAIHAATGSGLDVFLTNDRGFKDVPTSANVIFLDDLLPTAP